MSGSPMRAEGKYYGSQGGNGAYFLLSAMDRAGGRETFWSSPWCSTQGNQCCILNRNIMSIITVVRVELLCSAAFSQTAHWSQIGLSQNKKVSLCLCLWGWERMLDQENDVSVTFLYYFSGVWKITAIYGRTPSLSYERSPYTAALRSPGHGDGSGTSKKDNKQNNFQSKSH